MTENFNFVKTPHVLSDVLIRKGLTANEMHILEMIARYTLGFHRESSKLSLSFFANGTGLSIKSVKRALKKLIEKKLVIVTKPYTHSTPRELKINFFALGGDKADPRDISDPSQGTNMTPQGGGKNDPQEKKYINKTINKYNYPHYEKPSTFDGGFDADEFWGVAMKRADER